MEPFLAEIIMFAGNFAPRGWALCDGQILPINQNQSLYSLLGTTYGGDGQTSFALPDLRGRAPIHVGSRSGPSYQLGQKGGAERVTLSKSEIPAHTHTGKLSVSSGSGEEANPSGQYIASHQGAFKEEPTGANSLRGLVIDDNGGGQPHNNMQPFGCLNYIIAIQGIFPSRN
jgi:microcystin-dependent protein